MSIWHYSLIRTSTTFAITFTCNPQTKYGKNSRFTITHKPMPFFTAGKPDFIFTSILCEQKINATVRARFSGNKIIHIFSIYLQEQYSFAQNRIDEYETTTGAYNLVNVGMSFEFQFGKQTIQFNTAVNNLFNKAITTIYRATSKRAFTIWGAILIFG
jgi:outer membrane receptor for ferrienterochelin and colicin